MLHIKGAELEQLEVMKYIGVMITNDGSMEVEARIGSASRVVGRLYVKVLNKRELSRGTKLRKSSKCNNGTYPDIRLRNLGATRGSRIQDPGHANEDTQKD